MKEFSRPSRRSFASDLPEQEQHLLRRHRRHSPLHPQRLRPHWPQLEPHTQPAIAARSGSPSASSTEPHKPDKDSTTRHRIPTTALLPNPMLRCPSKPALPTDANPTHKIPDGTKRRGSSRSTYAHPSRSRGRAPPDRRRGHRRFANNRRARRASRRRAAHNRHALGLQCALRCVHSQPCARLGCRGQCACRCGPRNGSIHSPERWRALHPSD